MSLNTVITMHPIRIFVLMTIMMLAFPTFLIPWYHYIGKDLKRTFDFMNNAMGIPLYQRSYNFQKKIFVAYFLSMAMSLFFSICVLIFLFFIGRASRIEISLKSALIRQMESTQQAERKSMNKSNAFVRASHDIRNALTSIGCLIDFGLEEVRSISKKERKHKLVRYLTDMKKCINELEAILRTVLDTSKIEADKMMLEEVEFDIVELLEHAVDLYYPVAIRKNVDMILNFSDDVARFRCVLGDKEKLKKVLWNLLSNAVKYTCKGHIMIRAKAGRPRQETKLQLLSKQHQQLRVSNNEDESNKQKPEQSPNYVELWFEIDDTGIGIPKEKREMVFENYVQVKEHNLQLEGTGLGLGIVQSLVRLMGGEIEIIDKANNERGTCFRFTVMLSLNNSSNENQGEDIENGLVIKTPTRWSRTPSPALFTSHVVLLIASKERRRICHDFIRERGIRVSVIDRWDHLYSTLTKIKQNYLVPSCSSSGKSNTDSWSDRVRSKSKAFPLSFKDGLDRKIQDSMIGFVLLVIDAHAGPFQQLEKTISWFRKGLSVSCCKVVWLDKPSVPESNLTVGKEAEEFNLLGPLHGTRLWNILQLLPDFGKPSGTTVANHGENLLPSPQDNKCQEILSARNTKRADQISREIESESSSTSGSYHSPEVKLDERVLGDEQESKRVYRGPLSGSRCLVAEDSVVLRKLAERIVSSLGGTVQQCANGREAVELVCESFRTRETRSYDFILMDCQMPVMDGYLATKEIKVQVEKHKVRIPVIALSAEADDLKKMKEAGMDAQIVKPLSAEKLMVALKSIEHQAMHKFNAPMRR